MAYGRNVMLSVTFGWTLSTNSHDDFSRTLRRGPCVSLVRGSFVESASEEEKKKEKEKEKGKKDSARRGYGGWSSSRRRRSCAGTQTCSVCSGATPQSNHTSQILRRLPLKYYTLYGISVFGIRTADLSYSVCITIPLTY
jgi:hypothetical protein